MTSSDALLPNPNGEQSASSAAALDQPQQFADASSYQVRDKFQELVERDLLGPWGGEYEEFRPRASGPWERYLVGMLGPKHQPRSTVVLPTRLPMPSSEWRVRAGVRVPASCRRC